MEITVTSPHPAGPEGRSRRWIAGVVLALAIVALGIALAEMGWRAGMLDSTATVGAAMPDPHRRSGIHDFGGPSTLTTPNSRLDAPVPSEGPATPTTPKGR